MLTYRACIEFQTEENRREQTARGHDFLFAHPEQSTASRQAGEQPLLEAVFRWWRNRHAAWPDHWHRLCAVKIHRVIIGEIDGTGHLPHDNGGMVVEWKYDWPFAEQPCLDNSNPARHEWGIPDVKIERKQSC